MAFFATVFAVGLNVKAFNAESLNYRVMYKWGLVNKQAGHATLSLKKNGANYDTRLVAASEKWADKFYKVRDTLSGKMNQSTLRPVIYEKYSHEGGERKADVVKYTYSGNNVIGTCTRKKWNKKGQLTTDEKRSLSASGMTIDMLSSFYYMRNRPYENWKAGHTETVNLFSGKRKELLTIKYLGKETLTVDKKKYECYHITFRFTDSQSSKKQTSEPMEAWISVSSDRIPICLEGSLKVGKVQCFYTGSN